MAIYTIYPISIARSSLQFNTMVLGSIMNIRRCTEQDFDTIDAIINDAAQAYKGIIPADRWHEPYMTLKGLQHEIDDGVTFWGLEQNADLVGVMGIQDKGDVNLIRHAYVRTDRRRQGIGTRLLKFLEARSAKPILVGTWADAHWAIDFYRRNGYRLLQPSEKDVLLRRFWSIPERQIETSVVLANRNWKPR